VLKELKKLAYEVKENDVEKIQKAKTKK